MIKLEKKHPRVIRWNHWINFPILFMMIWSGFLIYWANDIYKISIGNSVIFRFFPESFYTYFNLNQRLAEGMYWHFFLMWIFTINGLIYVLYSIFSGEWKYIIPGKNAIKEAYQVILHSLKISKKPLPKKKFNSAQQIAYTLVAIMGVFSVLTGLAIYKPIQLSWLTTLLGGYEAARLEHFILTIGYILFFVVHIIEVIRAGWNNLRSMITGYEVVEDKTHE
ncbi:thiosulfate reductase [bacterium]|nr:MAG: thiosulfate reductase [bacterium]